MRNFMMIVAMVFGAAACDDSSFGGLADQLGFERRGDDRGQGADDLEGTDDHGAGTDDLAGTDDHGGAGGTDDTGFDDRGGEAGGGADDTGTDDGHGADDTGFDDAGGDEVTED
jgi:hypothetical protein